MFSQVDEKSNKLTAVGCRQFYNILNYLPDIKNTLVTCAKIKDL